MFRRPTWGVDVAELIGEQRVAIRIAHLRQMIEARLILEIEGQDGRVLGVASSDPAGVIGKRAYIAEAVVSKSEQQIDAGPLGGG